jgi:DNA-damage-inducible protein D
MPDLPDNHIALFRGKQVRKTSYNDQWWFAINDVIAVLTDSSNPAQYLRNIRNRDEELSRLFSPVDKGVVQIEPPLPLPFDTAGGKQNLLCWNTEGLLRLIQSIPSPKAEPFKRWLARVGYERIQEIEDPELATKRARALYESKGYSSDWIERRMRGIAIREELTNEWDKRGVKTNLQYAILTNEIAKATFNMTPKQHKELKGLERENLRNHMTDLELIFTMLGEASTTEITRAEDSQGFIANRSAAKRGGKVAGDARKQLEEETGKPVVSPSNYLDEPEQTKRLKD